MAEMHEFQRTGPIVLTLLAVWLLLHRLAAGAWRAFWQSATVGGKWA